MTESEYLFHERIAIAEFDGHCTPERAEQIAADEAQRREEKE